MSEQSAGEVGLTDEQKQAPGIEDWVKLRQIGRSIDPSVDL